MKLLITSFSSVVLLLLVSITYNLNIKVDSNSDNFIFENQNYRDLGRHKRNVVQGSSKNITDDDKKKECEKKLNETIGNNCTVTGTRFLANGGDSDLNLTYFLSNVTENTTNKNGTCVELYTQFLTNNTGQCEKYRCDKVNC